MRVESESRLAALTHDLGPDASHSPRAMARIMVETVDRAVGGRDETLALTDDPLPDEAFDWSGVPPDIHDKVAVVLDFVDRCCAELLDLEHRTAARRLLARAATADPAIFRRRGAPHTAAAAVCWLVGRANDSLGIYGRLQSKELLGWFEVRGSVSQRSHPFLAAIGVNPHAQFHGIDLGSVDYLVSERRRVLMERRDMHAHQL